MNNVGLRLLAAAQTAGSPAWAALAASARLWRAFQPTLQGNAVPASRRMWRTASTTRAGMRVLDNEYKLRQNIKIAMLYLEDDDAVNAEAFIKKAASLITSSKARARARPCHPCRLF